VTATISGGSGGTIGTLIGSTTATASSGVATFTGLGIDGTNGTTYTITYTVSGLTVATATVTLAALTCATGGTCIVGDTGPGGGKIFYVAPEPFWCGPRTGYESHCNYLEVAPTSGVNAWTNARYEWSGDATVQIGATAAGTAIGTGYANTSAIVGQASGGNTADRAATIARAYRGPNGLSDWFLPSKDELAQLYSQKTTVGGFVALNYWSSSEYFAYNAWYQYFSDGVQDNFYKDSSYHVRPVRAF